MKNKKWLQFVSSFGRNSLINRKMGPFFGANLTILCSSQKSHQVKQYKFWGFSEREREREERAPVTKTVYTMFYFYSVVHFHVVVLNVNRTHLVDSSIWWLLLAIIWWCCVRAISIPFRVLENYMTRKNCQFTLKLNWWIAHIFSVIHWTTRSNSLPLSFDVMKSNQRTLTYPIIFGCFHFSFRFTFFSIFESVQSNCTPPSLSWEFRWVRL